MADERKEWFAGYCRLARAAILLVLSGLALVVGGFYFVGPIFLGTGGSLVGLLEYLLGSLAIWHPTILFMAALWYLQRAAARLGDPEGSADRLASSLSLAGWLLLAGALAATTLRPLLLNSAWFARHLAEQHLAYPVWTSRLFDAYVAATVIGLAGLLLVLVGKVLRRHAIASTELQQIF
jgi:hypothetical protein